jgi:hypothetical protein
VLPVTGFPNAAHLRQRRRFPLVGRARDHISLGCPPHGGLQTRGAVGDEGITPISKSTTSATRGPCRK